jgi:hypothetical protein
MKGIERRIARLENVQVAQDEWRLVVCDKELPDGTLMLNGGPVGKRPVNGLVAFKRRPK